MVVVVAVLHVLVHVLALVQVLYVELVLRGGTVDLNSPYYPKIPFGKCYITNYIFGCLKMASLSYGCVAGFTC